MITLGLRVDFCIVRKQKSDAVDPVADDAMYEGSKVIMVFEVYGLGGSSDKPLRHEQSASDAGVMQGRPTVHIEPGGINALIEGKLENTIFSIDSCFMQAVSLVDVVLGVYVDLCRIQK